MEKCSHFILFIHDFGPEILKVLHVMEDEYSARFGKTIHFKISDGYFNPHDMSMLGDTF